MGKAVLSQSQLPLVRETNSLAELVLLIILGGFAMLATLFGASLEHPILSVIITGLGLLGLLASVVYIILKSINTFIDLKDRLQNKNKDK